MNYVELKLQFADSASLRLLRADNAPLSLAVLFAAFKHEHSSAVPETRVQITLPELLELRPPRNGILEVLAYLLIAESDGPHIVLEAFDQIELPGQTERRYRVPQIVFSNT